MKYAVTTARQLVDAHGQEIIQIEEAYSEYFSQFDLQLLVLPLLSNMQAISKLQPELVLLPGGGDVPAEYYDSRIEVISQDHRNSIEKALIDLAVINDIPLLGICRGMQMINGFFGGKLTRDIKHTHPISVDHTIQALCWGRNFEANSFHRDVIRVRSLSKELKAIALDKNSNYVEAFIGVKHRILGLQWHPERMDKDSACRDFSNTLISSLLKREVT